MPQSLRSDIFGSQSKKPQRSGRKTQLRPMHRKLWRSVIPFGRLVPAEPCRSAVEFLDQGANVRASESVDTMQTAGDTMGGTVGRLS
jgi:hypothetical protein